MKVVTVSEQLHNKATRYARDIMEWKSQKNIWEQDLYIAFERFQAGYSYKDLFDEAVDKQSQELFPCFAQHCESGRYRISKVSGDLIDDKNNCPLIDMAVVGDENLETLDTLLDLYYNESGDLEVLRDAIKEDISDMAGYIWKEIDDEVIEKEDILRYLLENIDKEDLVEYLQGDLNRYDWIDVFYADLRDAEESFQCVSL